MSYAYPLGPSNNPPVDDDLGNCIDCGAMAERCCTHCEKPICGDCVCADGAMRLCDSCSWELATLDESMVERNRSSLTTEQSKKETERLVHLTIEAAGIESHLAIYREWELSMHLCGVNPDKFRRELRQMIERRRMLERRVARRMQGRTI